MSSESSTGGNDLSPNPPGGNPGTRSPAHRTVNVGGEDVNVAPIPFGLLSAFASNLEHYTHLFSVMTNPVGEMSARPAALAALLARLTGRSEKWINGLPACDVAALLLATIEANEDFFCRSLPALTAAGIVALEAAGG